MMASTPEMTKWLHMLKSLVRVNQRDAVADSARSSSYRREGCVRFSSHAGLAQGLLGHPLTDGHSLSSDFNRQTLGRDISRGCHVMRERGRGTEGRGQLHVPLRNSLARPQSTRSMHSSYSTRSTHSAHTTRGMRSRRSTRAGGAGERERGVC